MAKTDHLQASFSGGEFGPSLYGRTDIAQYSTACEIVENMIIRPYGGAISTPGTKFIGEVKDSTKKTRLIPFVFNRSDAYVIEMSPGYFRFYTRDSIVITTGTTAFTLVHPYTESELFDVQFAQLNDIIWMCHPDHPIQQLIRYAESDWEIKDFAVIGGPFMDDNSDDAITLTPSASSGTINITVSPTNSNIFVPSSGTTKGHWNTYWKIGMTTTNSTTGLDEQGYVQITNVVNSYTATASVIKILDISSATPIWAEGAWNDVNGYPSSVTFHEQRLYVARTDQEPQKIWGSKSFVYDDFALDGSKDDDAINIQVASNEANEIQWLTAGSSLIAGTFGGEFVIGGGDTGITPTNINVKKQSSWGSEKLIPMRIGNYFYYIPRYGKKMRELFYFWDLDSYKSIDKTIFSPQVLDKGVVDMTYQQNPDTVIYCVLTNGTIATLTREVDQEVQAWSRQITDGTYESITTIPSQTELYDQVWVVVKRSIIPTGGTVAVDKRYIEIFQNIDLPDRQDKMFYVHSGLEFDAYTETTTQGTTTLTAANLSLSVTTGTTCVVSSSAPYFVSGDVGQRIRAIDTDGVTLGELEITAYTSSTIVIGKIKKSFSAPTYSSGYWGVSVTELSGFDHLEGKTIVVLADGGLDKPDKVVSAGSITLAYNYFVAIGGLPFKSKLLTLPAEDGSQRGTSQGKIQRINQVAFKVNKSHKGFKTGGCENSDDESLVERINFRDPSTLLGTPELLYTGIIPNTNFRDDYRYGSRVMVLNDDPLPIEILNIISTLDTNDK